MFNMYNRILTVANNKYEYYLTNYSIHFTYFLISSRKIYFQKSFFGQKMRVSGSYETLSKSEIMLQFFCSLLSKIQLRHHSFVVSIHVCQYQQSMILNKPVQTLHHSSFPINVCQFVYSINFFCKDPSALLRSFLVNMFS